MTRPDGEQAIDDYLGALTEPRREALQRLRDIVHRTVPGATERFAYRIPIIRVQQDLVGFSAAARHLSLHVMSTGLVAQIMARHPEVRGSGATIHFTEDEPLPEELIEEILHARLEENREWRTARGR